MEILMQYLEKTMLEQLDFYIFQKVYYLNKFYHLNLNQNDPSRMVEFHTKEFTFLFDVYPNDPIKGEAEWIPMDSKHNFENFKSNINEKFVHMRTFNLFYKKQQDWIPIDSKIEYINMLYIKLMDDDENDDNIQIDIVMKDIVEETANCYICGALFPYSSFFVSREGGLFCEPCYIRENSYL